MGTLIKKCKVCHTFKKVKFHVIADDLENAQPYCDKCWQDFTFKVIMAIGSLK